MIAARMIGEIEVHRWTDHRAAKNFFDTWLLLLRRPERSLSGDVFMDLIALLIQIISGAVRGTLRAIRSKTKNNQL